MIQKRITYVKRCLNTRCTHKEQCEHGKAMIRFLKYFPKGVEEIPPSMINRYCSIYPVAPLCNRWELNASQCIELQNKLELKYQQLYSHGL